MRTELEFRPVLFRSEDKDAPLPIPQGGRGPDLKTQLASDCMDSTRQRCVFVLRKNALPATAGDAMKPLQIGRASCRERGEISVVGVSLKKKKSIYA